MSIQVNAQKTLYVRANSSAYLDNLYPTTNYGTSQEIDAIAWSAGSSFVSRSVFNFDLSSIPSGSTVISAYLSMWGDTNTSNTQGDDPLSGSNAWLIQRVTSSWASNTVTWNTQPSTTTVDEISMPQSTSKYEIFNNINVTNLAQDIINNNPNNNGLLIKLSTESQYRSMVFCSSQYKDSTQRPLLVITYQPDTNTGGGSPDTCINLSVTQEDYLHSLNPTTNYSSSKEIDAIAWSAGGSFVSRSLLDFNFSAIPSGATIISATLSLYGDSNTSNSQGDDPLSGSNDWLIQRVTSPWTGNTVTWNTQPTSTTTDEVAMPQSTSKYEDFPGIDITTLTQDIVNNLPNDYGMLIRLNTESQYRSMVFCSNNYQYAARRPQLEVCYRKPNVNTPLAVSTGTVKNVTCNGGSNGSATVIAYGGKKPYKYNWAPPSDTNATDTGLIEGSYVCTVADAAGDTVRDTIKISQPTPVAVTVVDSNTTCGKSNGEAMASVSGGTSPYAYLWNTSPAQTTASAGNLTAGTYTLIVTDKNKCSATATTTIGASSAPYISVKVTPSNCGASNGKAVTTVTGGTTPYIYSWNNGDNQPTADSLKAGTYIVIVTDKKGCSSFKGITVSDTNGPSITVSSVTNILCNGASTGAASVTVSGGVSPYQYLWSNGATTSGVSGLSAGPYQVTVTDAFGCNDIKTIDITTPTALTISDSSTQAGCGLSNGSASVTVSGGVPGYSYMWNTGATTSSINNVAAGTYSVTVTDTNGCSISGQASVSNTSGPVVTIDSIVNEDCTAGTSGSISVTTTGGTPPYQYLWSNGETTYSINGLSSGTYNVTVTDAGGCVGSANANVSASQPPAISICMVTVDPATNHNTIVWDKSLTRHIAQYNIYKETTSPGVFNKIGSVLAANGGTYVDSLSNALTRSWRYEISQVDSCGDESPLSLPHKTMHLTISPGYSGAVNLVWDNYEGLSFGYYIVYRDSVPGIAVDSIDYVTNNGTYTYTDYPPTGMSWYYHMGISNPGGCTPSIQSLNYNSSKSNSGNLVIGPTSVQNIGSLNRFELYPNPTKGVFNISFTLNKQQDISVNIFNALGQALIKEKYNKLNGQVQKQYDMSAYGKGVYFVQVIGDEGVEYRNVIIQ